MIDNITIRLSAPGAIYNLHTNINNYYITYQLLIFNLQAVVV